MTKSQFVRNAIMLVSVVLFFAVIYAVHSHTGIDNNLVERMETPNHRMELIRLTNFQRQDRLQEYCIRKNLTHRSYRHLRQEQMDHLIVDKQRKLLYCYVPKVACTNFKRIMMLWSGKWTNGSDPLRIPGHLAHAYDMFDKFSNLSALEQAEVLANYTRFIVVRHPFERLLSAFRNKFEGDLPSAKYFQSRIGRLIIRNLRPHATNESLLKGNDVTFNEFIRYLLTPELSRGYQANSSFNEHWESMAELCHPCMFSYNLIGRYETLHDDAELLLDTIGVKNVTFPVVKASGGTASRLNAYFDNLPIGTVRNLYKLYEVDFKMFDYGIEDILGLELG